MDMRLHDRHIAKDPWRILANYLASIVFPSSRTKAPGLKDKKMNHLPLHGTPGKMAPVGPEPSETIETCA